MGLMGNFLNIMFGSGGNVVRETAEVFRENSEAASARETGLQHAAIEAFAAEFSRVRSGRFDRFMDGLNRVPRPALALSTLGLFLAAMVNPNWFAIRMQGVALVPEPLWWLMGAIVSFYFGARQQMKGQEFQRAITGMLARSQQFTSVVKDTTPPPVLFKTPAKPKKPRKASRKLDFPQNAALADWQEARRGK